MSSQIATFATIFFSMILVNNYVLVQFLGICPFLGVSKKLDSSAGMGAAVIVVMVIATAPSGSAGAESLPVSGSKTPAWQILPRFMPAHASQVQPGTCRVPGFQGAASRRRFDPSHGTPATGSICVVVQRSTRPPARMSSRPSVLSNVDLPPLPIIAVMPGSILSAEARLPLTVSICSPPYNTVIINNHQSSGRTAFALLKP